MVLLNTYTCLTLKQLEWIWMCNKMSVSIVTADALVLKHQAISIHNIDSITGVPNVYHKNINLIRTRWVPKSDFER